MYCTVIEYGGDVLEIHDDIKRFIFGGWSKFHITQFNSDGTSVEEYYEVKHSPKNRRMYFVYARDLCEKRLYYHGYITDYPESGISYQIAKKPKLKSMEYYNKKAIDALLWVLNHSDSLPNRVRVISDKTCARCGRPIENELDVTGFCPICRGRMGI